MRHVKQIQELVDEGQIQEAYAALDDLLSLGPRNTEALKLQARLYEHEGRFDQAEAVWAKLAEADPEDEDAIDYILRRHFEDREHFFFTDDLPNGERRFLAYPRKVISSSAIGLLGSLVFLLFSKVAENHATLSQPSILLSAFLVLVIAPWLAIIWAYLKSMRFVSLSREGIEVATRFRSHRFQWNELAELHVAYSAPFGTDDLALVLIPTNDSKPIIEISLAEGVTGIRARCHFLKEISRVFAPPKHTERTSLPTTERRIIRI